MAAFAVIALTPLIAMGAGLWLGGAALSLGHWRRTRDWQTPDAGLMGVLAQVLAIPLTISLVRCCVLLVRWGLGVPGGHLVPWWLAAWSSGAVALTFIMTAGLSSRPDLPVALLFSMGIVAAFIGWIATRSLAKQQGAWPLFKRD